MNEAETCRLYVQTKLAEAGWAGDRVVEQYFFTDGRVITTGKTERRGKRKFADYLLRTTRDLPLAIVEAKAEYKLPAHGLQQGKQYAQILGLPFVYATNGHGIVEFDQRTGETTEIDCFPTPDELWTRFRAEYNLQNDVAISPLLQPDYLAGGKTPRYYQRIAINRAVEAIAKGRNRALLTMATGTGKTTVAFQICWKLHHARWNRAGTHREPRILYLADRTILVDDPHAKDFAPFGDARSQIESANVSRARSMYFSTYHALAGDGTGKPLYEGFPRDFFDLIIVDECHRGSAREESSWRDILNYFAPAAQLGMTATPLRLDNRDTYNYFGEPIYQYSLRQGIDDGFLAPYRVHRVVSDWDATGFRPEHGALDRFQRLIPDEEYGTPDFERKIALKQRTLTIAKHLARYLQETDDKAKTIVFCVDQPHALEMMMALANEHKEQMKTWPNFVVRITADEGDVGKSLLDDFQDIEGDQPVIVTTSQLLSTGVDIPTCKNVVLARLIGSMTEFKQIIGRGTRIREDYGKLSFAILDYTGTATRHFADADFDGDPIVEEVIVIRPDGSIEGKEKIVDNTGQDDEGWDGPSKRPGRVRGGDDDDGGGYQPGDPPRKFYYDDGAVQIVAHQVMELDPDGNLLRTVAFTDYTGEKVRILVPTAADLRSAWVDPVQRQTILDKLAERGLTPETIADQTCQPEADTFDLLCHLAFGSPLRTRRDRATKLEKERAAFFDRYAPEARQILQELVAKYATHGVTQLKLPDVLQIPPLSRHGNPSEIAAVFGGPAALRSAVVDLQTLLYADDAPEDAA